MKCLEKITSQRNTVAGGSGAYLYSQCSSGRGSGALSLRSVMSAERIPGQSGLHRNTLPQKQKYSREESRS